MIKGKIVGSLGILGLLLTRSVTGQETEPPAGYKLDWYHWAEVSANPYMTCVYNLCDGNPNTASRYEGGPEVAGTFSIHFPKPLSVTAFRFIQGKIGAKDFKLSGDIDGDGKFETDIKIVRNQEIIAGSWLTVPINKKLYGLEFLALTGNAGYRCPFPQFREVEIYTTTKVNLDPGKKVLPQNRITPGQAVRPPKMQVRNIENIICTDFWHAGLQQNGSNLPEDLNSFKSFRTLVESLKLVEATGVRIFSETSCCDNRIPWPTNLGPHTEKNVLKAYVDALHKEGFKVYFFTHAWITPFQKADKIAPMPWRRWDYPYEQSDRFVDREEIRQYYPEKYPCVISESDFHDKWLWLLSEAVAQGVDGLYLMPDEYYFKGHNLPRTNCPACTRAFKDMFGYPSLPEKPGDNEKYRKWELFEYEQLYALFNDVAAKLKKLKPNLKIFSNGNQAMVQLYNTRLEHGVALDILGRDKIVDAGTVYGGVTVDTGKYVALCRRFAGAFGKDRLEAAIQWLNITYNGTHDPIKMYGYILPTVMEGVRYISNYRINYMLDWKEWRPTVIAGFQRMRLLEQWGIGKSHTPATVCLILSRASEDWWEVKMEGLLSEQVSDSSLGTVLYLPRIEELTAVLKRDTDTRTRELNYERFRGMVSGKCVEGLLLENGIPYDVRFAERPDTLDDLGKYKLLILPFAYSLSRESFAAIKKAVETGSRLLILDQLGSTDQYGNPYPEPLLKRLLDSKNVAYQPINLARQGMKKSVRQNLLSLIKKMRGETGLRFEPDGRVEFLIRKVEDGNFILYLANWESRPAVPVIGLDLPSGRYSVTLVGGDSFVLKQGLVNGQTKAEASFFQRFALPLAPREVVLLHLEPETGK
ncbi:MAG: hypothetical protein NC911_00165 [Candidatus Omnitrophica bacterium]|nr:hypothetical protein [Candidatus Omnitrophota bacterium]